MARTEIQIGTDGKQVAPRINQKGVNDPHIASPEQNIITINLNFNKHKIAPRPPIQHEAIC